MYTYGKVAIHWLFAYFTIRHVAKWAANGQLVSTFQTKSADTFENKLELWAIYVSIHALIQVITLLFVAFGRLFSDAKNPLSGNDHQIEVRRRIQTNTFEQSVLSVFAQLTLLPYLPISVLVHLLPAINFLFILGRITFALGYPNQRVYGFSLTFQPPVLAILYSTLGLLISHGLVNAAHKQAIDQYVTEIIANLRN